MTEEIIVPYNINNVLITSDDIKILFKKFDMDIQVKDIELYRLALTHKSYIISEYTNYNAIALKNIKESMGPNIVELRQESYERLEHYGDTVIKKIIAGYLFKRYYKEDEGFLTKTKTKIEDKKSLAVYARKLGIDNFILMSKQNEEAGSRDANKFLEDTFEAFIGALDFDQGGEFSKTFFTKFLETEVDYAEILYIDTNFKEILQKFYHQNGWSHPDYKPISEEIVNGKRLFTVAVLDAYNNEIIQAQETSKPKAEKKAAMLTLLKYGQLYPDQIVTDFDS